jgi:hypothetical protein
MAIRFSNSTRNTFAFSSGLESGANTSGKQYEITIRLIDSWCHCVTAKARKRAKPSRGYP